MMKTIAALIATVMIFAGCSARQKDMVSDVESSISSALTPSSSSSAPVEESRPEMSSESGIMSESDPMVGEKSTRTIR